MFYFDNEEEPLRVQREFAEKTEKDLYGVNIKEDLTISFKTMYGKSTISAKAFQSLTVLQSKELRACVDENIRETIREEQFRKSLETEG